MTEATSVVERNLRMLVQGQEVGGTRVRVGRTKDGNRLAETESLIRMTLGDGDRDDRVIESRAYSLECFDSDGRMRWIRTRATEGEAATTMSVRFSVTHARIKWDSPDGDGEERIELPADFSSDYQVFQSLVRDFRRNESSAASYSRWVGGDIPFEAAQMTVIEKTSVTHRGKKHDGFLIQMEGGRIVVDADFVPMRATRFGIYEIKWIDAPPFDFSPSGWNVSSSIPVEGLAPTSKHLESLEMIATLVEDDPAPVFSSNRYQDVKRDGKTYSLTLGSTRPKLAARLEFPLEVTDERAKHYLSPTLLSQSDHPLIVERAKKIVDGSGDAIEAATRIVQWVYTNLEKSSGTISSASSIQALRARIGDCTEHAALVVALCRAVGIPARNVRGIMYFVARGAPRAGYHAWAEIWLGVWTGVDATIPEVGTAARYILLYVDEPGESVSLAERSRALLGKVRLRVTAYRPQGGKRTVVER